MSKPITIQQFTVGLKITMLLHADLSGATALVVRLQKPYPDRSPIEHDLNLNAILDPKQGKVQYISRAGDFDLVGQYKLEIVPSSPDYSLPSEVQLITVLPSLS